MCLYLIMPTFLTSKLFPCIIPVSPVDCCSAIVILSFLKMAHIKKWLPDLEVRT